MRGRALYPIRPGLIIKQQLLEVGEASITDLHRHYKDIVAMEQRRREAILGRKAGRLNRMVYENFRKYFAHFARFHLVELVREEDIEFPPPAGLLYRIEDGAGGNLARASVVASKRRIFRLTAQGEAEENAWLDPQRLYRRG